MGPRPHLGFVLAALVLPFPARAGDPDDVLTGVERTAHFDLRFRPGSRAAASVERTAAMAERDYERITAALQFRPEGRFVLCLYDDIEELAEITGVRGTGGFSAGNRCHLPRDDDQTRFHEMVHVIAHALPKAGDEPRNLFVAEGLANALLEYVHGVPVHAVAAFYRKREELPPLAEMTGARDFYVWLRERPGFDAYDVAGSYLRHLLDAHGPEKVKRWYTGTPARKAFGADEAALEASWHRVLDAYVLRPEVETLLRQRAGEKAEFRAFGPDFAAIEGKPGDWTSFLAEDIRSEEKGTWSREGSRLAGKGAGGEWRVCELGATKRGNAAVRAKVDLSGGCGALQVRLGPGCQAMLVGNGTFVWRNGAATAADPEIVLGNRREVDLVLVRRGGTAEIWVDGKRVVTGPCGTEPAAPGVGFVNGSVVFREIAVRSLE